MRLARLLFLGAVAVGLCIPRISPAHAGASGVGQLLPVGTIVPHLLTNSGVLLASVECIPSGSLRLPDGLAGSVAQDYVAAHQADVQMTPCATPTKLIAQVPIGASTDNEQAHFAAATAAYASVLRNSGTQSSALSEAKAAFEAPISSGPSANTFQPLTCIGGNWYQYNYDTVLDIYSSVHSHVDWELYYSVASGSGCNHFFSTTKFHIIDGGSTWWQWSEISTGNPNNPLPNLTVGDYNNNKAYTDLLVSTSYNNNSTTQASNLEADTSYCSDIFGFGLGCSAPFMHSGDNLTH